MIAFNRHMDADEGTEDPERTIIGAKELFDYAVGNAPKDVAHALRYILQTNAPLAKYIQEVRAVMGL